MLPSLLHPRCWPSGGQPSFQSFLRLEHDLGLCPNDPHTLPAVKVLPHLCAPFGHSRAETPHFPFWKSGHSTVPSRSEKETPSLGAGGAAAVPPDPLETPAGPTPAAPEIHSALRSCMIVWISLPRPSLCAPKRALHSARS